MKKKSVKFICQAGLWHNNGNTYHACTITRTKDQKTIHSKIVYGYGDHYRQTTLEIMFKAGWIPEKYTDQSYMYERENGYPIYWTAENMTKKELKQLIQQ